jgi:nucleotide-binding universal stress UspA family protein
MIVDAASTAAVKRVMVATDRSTTANRAVDWAKRLAEAHGAELLLLQVANDPATDAAAIAAATADLMRSAENLAGGRGRAKVVVDADPAQAIFDAIDDEQVDVVVVGNVGMSGRKQFLLGNIPNRISHNARCSIVIVNTMAPDAAAPSNGTAASRRAKEKPGLKEGQLLRRAWRIGWILVGAGAGALGSRSADNGSRAQHAARRFRDALDQLGPTFAKLGQILSTRPDLLPPEFVDELATLQERVTPLTEAEVFAAMERELGVPWEEVFASIDPKPLAAGTIAQVHRATLENGDRVVVKVQRPTAEQDITQDVALLELFGEKAANRPAFRQSIDVPAMIEHLSSSLRKELDFGNEARNMQRWGRALPRCSSSPPNWTQRSIHSRLPSRSCCEALYASSA